MRTRVNLTKTIRKHLLNEQAMLGYLFILPVGIAFVLFVFYPMVYSFLLSLTDWNGFSPIRDFVGLSNYARLLEDRHFYGTLFNTVYYTIGHVPLTMAAGLAAALILNQQIRGVSAFRTLIYIPNVTPYVAASVIWLYVLNPDWGILNWILSLFHLPTPSWLGDPKWAMPGIIIFSVWKGMGFHMIIYLAGLQQIPEELYEAAMIDGAGRSQLFRYITWPLLTPTTFFLIIFSGIGSFKVFTSIYVMTEGGPAGATSVLVYRIYQEAFQFFEMGYASAMSYVLFAIILVMTIIQFKFVGTRVQYLG